MRTLQPSERIHLVDKKGRPYALTLKAGEVFQFSGETIAHDDLIGQEDGVVVTLSKGRRMVAFQQGEPFGIPLVEKPPSLS